jgi:hypothetical protein
MLGIDEFVLERLDRIIVQLELQLQDPIGDPSAAPEQLDDLVDHCKEVHHHPST